MAKSLLQELVEALQILPGVGPRSAQRMALQVLERDREGGRELARNLEQAVERIGRCRSCRNLTEHEQCAICANPERSDRVICVVESPADVMALEQAGVFTGRYFVLLGRLSPLDGIGPEELGLEQLEQRFDQGEIEEVIIATNANVEGEATAWYIREMAENRNINITRLAQGVPLGGELEYTDQSTLALAFQNRRGFEG